LAEFLRKLKWKVRMNGNDLGLLRPSRATWRHGGRCLLLIALALIWLNARDSSAEPLIVDSALVRLIQQVEVPARAQGVLASLLVTEGDSVELGAVLAQIDDAEAKLLQGRAAIELQLNQEKVDNDVAIRSAQKALAFGQAELKRFERAAQGIPGSVSVSELEEVRLRAEKAGFDLEDARLTRRQDQLNVDLKNQELDLSKHNVEIRRIIAPINGVVVQVLKQPGEWVEPGEKVLRIVRIDRLRVEGLIPVDDLPPDLRGAPVSITLDRPGGTSKTVSGKVVFVSPEINPVNGQVRIWAEVDNKDGILKPGLRPKMKITPPVANNAAAASSGRPPVAN
jgi:macrolide-specific efflux system membrane fusion protein